MFIILLMCIDIVSPFMSLSIMPLLVFTYLFYYFFFFLHTDAFISTGYISRDRIVVPYKLLWKILTMTFQNFLQFIVKSAVYLKALLPNAFPATLVFPTIDRLGSNCFQLSIDWNFLRHQWFWLSSCIYCVFWDAAETNS